MTNTNIKLSRRSVVDNFLHYQTSSSMQELVDFAYEHGLPDLEIVKLAKGLAIAGYIFQNSSGNLTDVPSTGGPGSLSTLLCPILLNLSGSKVLKLGVPGRPAGGIDVLSNIPGYEISPSKGQIQTWLNNNGYVHFLANDEFAPLDATLFAYRKSVGRLNVPDLAISSLLSKKIAAGLNTVGLDVRVFRGGNFGATYEEARINAIKFNRIARMCEINSCCFLTDGRFPQQPYLGRGESILAIKDLFENQNIHLNTHLSELTTMALFLNKNKLSAPTIEEIKRVFFKNIEIQGGSETGFNQIADKIRDSHKSTIKAPSRGYLHLDMLELRSILVNIQDLTDLTGIFPDPCGLILRKMCHEIINEGDDICSWRCIEPFAAGFELSLQKCFQIKPMPQSINELEIIQ